VSSPSGQGGRSQVKGRRRLPPRAVVEKLNRDICRAMNGPEVKDRVAAQSNLVVRDTPDEFAAYIRREAAKWSKVVKDAQIKID